MVRDTTDPTATTEGMPPGGFALDPALDLMKGQLREKDHLVAALTERLEQAAEQLDRLRRTGVDKGNRPIVGSGGTGMPAELVQDHKSTLDELKRVINNWEDMQAGATLGRIETQVVELRDLISNHLQQGGSLGGSGGGSSAGRDRVTPAIKAPAVHAPSGAAPSSWWERQKAAMLGESPPESGDAATTAPQKAESASDAENAESDGPAVDLGAVQIPDAPHAVDFGSITLEDALQAIRDRDAIIEQLRQPLLLLQAANQLPRDLQAFDQLPEALRHRIAELETKWESKYRQAELELSLERARLAREAAHVHQQQEALQKQLKQHGLGLKDASDGSDREDGANRRRWFRFMGKNGEEGKDGSPDPK